MNCVRFSRITRLAVMAAASLIATAVHATGADATRSAMKPSTEAALVPPRPRAAEQSSTSGVLRVADAASAAYASDMRTVEPQQPHALAEPPALLIYLAGLVVIVFVTTRRRREDN